MPFRYQFIIIIVIIMKSYEKRVFDFFQSLHHPALKNYVEDWLLFAQIFAASKPWLFDDHGGRAVSLGFKIELDMLSSFFTSIAPIFLPKINSILSISSLFDFFQISTPF